jgi:hypothetical protein
MNTDKEREKTPNQEAPGIAQQGLWIADGGSPGVFIPIALAFSFSVFIRVHLWFQGLSSCA